MASEEVEIELTTKLPEEYQVPSDPLVVPSRSARWPLSELVNQLLSSEDEDREKTPFDFLVEGKFLRGTLQEWMVEHERTAERKIVLEYVLAMRKPETKAVDNRDAWVSTVCASAGVVWAGWYDGVGRAYAGGKTVEWRDASAVRCLAAQSLDGTHAVVNGDEDGQVHIATHSPQRQVVGTGAHAEAVTACALSQDAALAATGDCRGGLRLWHVDPAVDGGAKRKAQQLDPKLTLEGHGDLVSACTVRGFSLLTASHDMHVRTWDILSGSLVASWPCRAAATSLAVHKDLVRLATSHVDGGVQVWDVRCEQQDLKRSALEVSMTHSTHKRLVAGVAWCPDHDFWIATASHDKTVKVYDIRSPTALQSVHVGAKGTCVA